MKYIRMIAPREITMVQTERKLDFSRKLLLCEAAVIVVPLDVHPTAA